MEHTKNNAIIACDVGLKRIGLATVINGVILPLEPILRKNRNQAANALATFLQNRGASVLVVGLPQYAHYMDCLESNDSKKLLESTTLNALKDSMSNSNAKNATATRIKHFIGLLDITSIGCEVVFVNEDFSSAEAMQNLSHTTKSTRKKASKDGRLDSLAACEILRRYLVRLEF